MEVIQIGNLWGNETDFINKTSGRVYDAFGISPALNTMQGGWKQPMIIEAQAIKMVRTEKGKELRKEYGNTCPTLMASEQDLFRIESYYRIRKLTPLECWRLMDFADEDFKKAESVNSNSQLYKQAGNSIVKNVLMAIFGQMIPGKEEVYKTR